MKHLFADALLLFRLGDFYELYGADTYGATVRAVKWLDEATWGA